MNPAAVVLLLLAQQPVRTVAPEPSPKQKEIEATISQIRRLAASEPVAFGIDTRLRAANVLPASYAKVASELLRDDESELAGVASGDEQRALRVQIAAAWARFDLDQAERAVQPLQRTEQHDYPAEAYDRIYLVFQGQAALARGIVSDGLKSGAFRMMSAARVLEESPGHDRTAAAGLFSEMLTAFPVSFWPADISYLLEQSKQIAPMNRALAQEGVAVALRAADSERIQDQPKEERRALFRKIEPILESIDPALRERFRKDHEAEFAQSQGEPKAPEQKDQKTLDVAGLSYSDGLTEARAIESLNDRVEKLIELSRREDLTADQRTSVASEALQLLAVAPITSDRLVGIAMIARDFARRNEGSRAGLAAQMLAERYSKACDCGNAKCTLDQEQFDCLASVQDFAEYLDEFKVTPESMGLSNISLDARLLIFKLKTLLSSR